MKDFSCDKNVHVIKPTNIGTYNLEKSKSIPVQFKGMEMLFTQSRILESTVNNISILLGGIKYLYSLQFRKILQ